MRIVCVLLLAFFYVACAPQPRRAPVASLPRAVRPSPQPPINYLKTLGGGWRVKLSDDHRRVEKCQYGLRVGPARRFTRTLYLRAEFQNPLAPSRPLVTETKLEPWVRELSIASPEVRGLKKGGRYSIRVHVFEDPARKRRIGFHDQTMPSRFNVNRDSTVSF